MQARMTNPVSVVPGALKAVYALSQSVQATGVPGSVLELIHLRASQINGCGFCVDYGVKSAKKAGETDERLHGVAAWREMPYFTDAERAALALSESMTRLADRADAVPDDVWEAAAKHYGEQELAALVLWIATTNFYNRVNATTRQQAGSQTW